MCGIWLSIGASGGRRHIDEVAHRGPDGEGWKHFQSPRGDIAIGHRRLSVVDPRPIADQPYCDQQGSTILTFNGEIYNHRSLRRELESMGEAFLTDCDTEVLLLGLKRQGLDFVGKLDGMFAFAFLDLRRRKILAARDRFGIKPMYLHSSGLNLALASEIKQFRHLPDFHLRPDAKAVQDYADGFGYPDRPRTMFEEVEEFEPGCLMEISIDDTIESSHGLQRWYRPQLEHRESGSLEENALFYREKLLRSVESQLQADVPVGSCLSGGLDSTMIAAMAAKEFGARLVTVTASFPGTYEDEWNEARQTAEDFGLPCNEVRVDLSATIAKLDRISYIHDEPLSSASPIAQWCVFGKAAEGGLKVMLDGQGPDECLGGYPTMVSSHVRNLYRDGRYAAAALSLMAMRSQLGGITGIGRLLSRQLGHGHRVNASRTSEARAVDEHPDQFQDMVFRKSLPRLLQWEDRNSMAHGIESRVPFLEHHLVEFSLRLPVEQRIGAGWTKRVLREAARDLIPDRIRLNRLKRGFLVPSIRRDDAGWEIARHWKTCGSNRLGLPRSADRNKVTLEGEDWLLVSLGAWAEAFDLSL